MSDFLYVGMWALLHDPLIKAVIIKRGVKHEKLGERIYSLLLHGKQPPSGKVKMFDRLSSNADRALYFKGLKVIWNIKENRVVKHPISNRSFEEMLRCASPSGRAQEIIRDIMRLIDLMSSWGVNSQFTEFYGKILSDKLESVIRSEVRKSRPLASLLFPRNSWGADFLTLIYLWRWLHLLYYYAILESGLYSSISERIPHRDARGLLLFVLDKALPADTRAPYNPLMDHLESTLALSSILHNEKDRNEDLSVLHFSLDGIEEFLSESRTTADFWTSSLMVSALTWSVMRGLLESGGDGSPKYTPANIVYPAQRGSVWMDLYLANLASKDRKRNLKDYLALIADERGYLQSPGEETGINQMTPELEGSVGRDTMRELLSDALRPELPGNFLAWVSHDDAVESRLRESYRNGLELLFSKTLKGIVKFEAFRNSFTLRPKISKWRWFKLKKGERLRYWDIIRRAYQGDHSMGTVDLIEMYEKYAYNKKLVNAQYSIAHHLAKLELGRAPASESGDEDRIHSVQEGKKCTVCGWRTAIIGWDMEASDREELEKYLRPRERLCPVCLAKRILGRDKYALLKFLEGLGLLPREMIDGEEGWEKLVSVIPSFPSTDDVASAPYAAIIRWEKDVDWRTLMRGRICQEGCEERAEMLGRVRRELARRLREIYKMGRGGHEVRKYLEDLLSFVDYVERLVSEDGAPASLLYEEVYARTRRAIEYCSNIEGLSDLKDLVNELGKIVEELERVLEEMREQGRERHRKKGDQGGEVLESFLSLGPSDYYAVLIADVDDVNSLLLSIIGPTVCERLHHKARRWILGNSSEEFLKTRALVTPTGHKALSRLLRHFMLYVAPGVVERLNLGAESPSSGDKRERIGWVVLAGGDQIYALVPGSEAPFIAAKLEEIFSLPIVEVGGRGGKNYFYGSDRSLTLSSAVVVAHRFHPVGDAFRRAKRLLREAKVRRKRYGRRWPEPGPSPIREEKVEGWVGIEVITRSNVRRSILPASSLRKMLELVKIVRGRRCLHCLDRPPLLARNFVRDVQGIRRYYGGDVDIAASLVNYWISRNLLDKEMGDEAESIASEALESLLTYGSEEDGFDPVEEFLQALLVLDRVTGT